MRDRFSQLADAQVVVATFSHPSVLREYTEGKAFPFHVLTDPNRDAYRAFGLGRGSIARIYGWRAARRYVQIFRSYGFTFDGFRRLHRSNEDTLQLGGDFVVDPDGVLAYGFWGAGPDDRPSVDELIDAIARASA